MENTQRIKLKADLMWAYLDKPNDMSGKYQVDLCNLRCRCRCIGRDGHCSPSERR
jgi:hypothetical protein